LGIRIIGMDIRITRMGIRIIRMGIRITRISVSSLAEEIWYVAPATAPVRLRPGLLVIVWE
jgi:hypothetical protein